MFIHNHHHEAHNFFIWKHGLSLNSKTTYYINIHMSLCMRKPTICIGENKAADQLRGNREADQRLCFRYMDSTILFLLKYKISNLLPYSVTVQPGLCQTWSEPQIVGFLTHRLILKT